MVERRRQELALIRERYGDVNADQDVTWFEVRRLLLVPGWNQNSTDIVVMVPPGYAVTPPDNFYADNGLRLASGAEPGNSSGDQQVLGSPRRIFSYHVDANTWRPGQHPAEGHNLVTFMLGVEARLRELS